MFRLCWPKFRRKPRCLFIVVFIFCFLTYFCGCLFLTIKVGLMNRQFLNFFDKEVSQLLYTWEKRHIYTYEDFQQWNKSLCSSQSNDRGPNQKVIAISVYGASLNNTDSTMFSWEGSILLFLKELSNEVKLLLPSWTIRVYTDFTGTNKTQRDSLYTFSNVDICDMNNMPLFGSSLLKYLPGKMWRFLTVFDPLVDYFISHDLDSPITRRQTETLDMWMSDEQKNNFFYIARDHTQHGRPILGGLWGASPLRSRRYLYNIFHEMLVPSIAQVHPGTKDQYFLSKFIWNRVRGYSLVFDSYYCRRFSGRPFLSQRPPGHCFLGCIRPCCSNTTTDDSSKFVDPCPKYCRPKQNLNWTYC